jgi:GxxExxY protein
MKTGPGHDLTYKVIGCAIEVHRHIGPGLLESLYETCLCDELASAGLSFVRQRPFPVIYKGRRLDGHFQLDVIVEEALVLEIKAVHQLLPVHEAQLQTYLRLSGLKPGLLMNFNTTHVKDDIRRILAPDAISNYVP